MADKHLEALLRRTGRFPRPRNSSRTGSHRGDGRPKDRLKFWEGFAKSSTGSRVDQDLDWSLPSRSGSSRQDEHGV